MKYIIFLVLLLNISTCLTAREQVRINLLLNPEPYLVKTVLADSASDGEAPSYIIRTVDLDKAAAELNSGEMDFVVCGSDMLPELKKKVKKLNAEPYAIEALAIAVHPSNEIEDIKLKDLRNIFGGKVISWQDYNGSGYMIHKNAPGTRLFGCQSFHRLLLDNQPVAKDVVLSNSADEPLIIARGNRHAMSCGVWSLRPDLPIKFLKVDGIEPTLANIRSGQYPLALTYYLCYTGANADRILKILRNEANLGSFGLTSLKTKVSAQQ